MVLFGARVYAQRYMGAVVAGGRERGEDAPLWTYLQRRVMPTRTPAQASTATDDPPCLLLLAMAV